MYGSILIPTDGSQATATAIEHGLGLARAYDATAHAISIIDSRTFHLDSFATSFEEAVKKEAEEAVESVIERATAYGVEVVSDVRRGYPSEAILEYADQHDIDLITMGTHGRTGLERALLGSVAHRVVRRARRPVLTARLPTNDAEEAPTSPAEPTYKNILLPTDGSKGERRAVEQGLDIAQTFGATVHVLYVVDSRTYTPYPTGRWQGIESKLQTQGERATKRITTQARDAELDVVTSIEEGVPSRTIVDYASDHDIDLIAMGTRGRSGLDKMLLGSVAEKVVTTAPMPVLTARTR
jgi:nucleotide-binding universal stress UspA family protein